MGASPLQRAIEACGPEAVMDFLRANGLSEIAEHVWAGGLARDEQTTPPGNWWDTWLVLAGRGWGKTRTGVEFIRSEVESGRMKRIALIAPTAADARDVMVEGESGILAKAPPWFRPQYEPSKRRLTWPNGAMATLYSGEEPDRLRGPQHDGFWADELPAWKDPQNAWDMLQMGLRLGRHPRGIITTTPRPIRILKELLKDPKVTVTKGTTYDNEANLARPFLEAIKRTYEGTRLGRQEIGAEILDDNPNALWKLATIESKRAIRIPDLRRVAVAIDPAGSSDQDSDETGIITGGIGLCSCKGTPEDHGFIFDDSSGIYTPGEWAAAAVGSYHAHRADRIVAETNFGGDLVVSNIKGFEGAQHIHVEKVTASRGKVRRAEPISALYEQGKVHHVGTFAKLEDQMTQWDPLDPSARSPDRMDALVWLLTDLFLGAQPATYRRAPMPLGTSRYGNTSRR
jgi:phage terminase large subunit-like protein